MATAKANAKNKKKFINDLLPANPGKTLGEKVHNLFRGQNSFLWFSFWIPVVIMYLIYLAMQIHPFGNGSVLVLDLNAQYVSFYEALREFVYGDTSLLYSFSRQLGGEFMGIYAYYIASPFSYIVALFPKERILEALLTIFLLKTGLCGFTCGFYLNRITAPEKRNKINVVIFSTMYALCSYAVVQQSNSMWIDALIWLPLLSYGIEELIKHRKFKLYVVTLALTVMSNYYIGYMVCIYVVLYFFYYFIAKSENKENNPIGEKSHFAKTLLRIIIFSIIAIGISALLIFTAYYSLTFGKNTFDPPEWKLEIKFDLMEYLVKFLKEKGIALYDTATSVRRLQDNASDKYLEVVEPTDIRLLLKQLPHCKAIVTTGQKATDIIRSQIEVDEPSVGKSCPFEFEDRSLRLYRMPSSSRAYPLALEKKSAFYRLMLKELGILE